MELRGVTIFWSIPAQTAASLALHCWDDLDYSLRKIRSVQPNFTLSGIGGTIEFVLVTTVIEFIRDSGRVVRVRGEFAGFTDPTATDLSVLGRDVLDNFDLILSRRRDEILLLAPNHQYRVEQG
jgi:hypothetical protein